MDGEQIFQLPVKKTIGNLFIFCFLLAGLSGGSFLIAISMQNAGYRILGYILGILFALLICTMLFQIIQVSRSQYRIEREGLTICWGFQRMVIPIQEIEWIRPYDQMGYTIPLPSLERIGILTGRLFYQDLGEILFFATRQQKAILIGTSQEVLFLSPLDADAFQEGIQEAVYLGSIAPLERKSIQMESPVRAMRANPALYIPLIIGIMLSLLLFVLFGFLVNRQAAIQVGLVLFESPAGIIIIPILATIFNVLNTIFAPRIMKNEKLRVYAYLLAYTGPFISFMLILSMLLGMIE